MDITKNTAAKQGLFKQEFRAVVETKSIFAPVATKLISKAKNIISPYISVGDAKAHTGNGRVPIVSHSLAVDELVLDRKIGAAITDYAEELSYARWDVIEEIRGDLYAKVMRKMNVQACTDFVAAATVVAGTRDLSSNALIQAFLIEIAADAEQDAVSLKGRVDGATIKRGSSHGKPFLACGRTAYIAVQAAVSTIIGQASAEGIKGKFFMTPHGVLVINMGSASDNAKRLIWGTGGALSMAFREDMIETDMGEFTGIVAHAGGTDLDVADGDSMLEKTFYISAQTKGKNGIYADVQELIKTQLMA